MNGTFDRVINLVMIGLAGFCAWCFWCIALDNTPSLSIDDAPEVVSTQPIPRNGTLIVRYKIHVERPCSGEGQRVFSDAAHNVYPAVPFEYVDGALSNGRQAKAGEDLIETVKIPVPNGAAPGPATYQNQTQFFCNWLQKITRHGIAFDYPLVSFAISGETLPKVEPSTSIFRPIRKSYDPMRWFKNHLPFPLPISLKETQK